MNVTILNDMAFEKTESFSLDIVSVVGNVVVHVNSTTITILDDDREYIAAVFCLFWLADCKA